MNGSNKALVGAVLLMAGCASTMNQPQAVQAHKVPSSVTDPQPELRQPLPPPTIPSTRPAESPRPKKTPADGPYLGYPQAKSEHSPAKKAPQPPSNPNGPASVAEKRSGTVPDPFTTVSRTSLMDEPRWERLHRSTDRRPIETVQLGTGRERVAVMASLHGDETQSITLVDQLARYVSGHADEFRDATVLFIRTPNPDGQAAKTPYNVRHVDLNRNFPASNWKLIQSKHTGDKPGSEVETRAIVRLISEFRPARLIHIKDGSGGGFVNHDGGLRELAQEVARKSSLKVVQDLGHATTGSVESYTWTQLHVPSLTLLVPKEAGELAAWDKNRTALLATIAGPTDPFTPMSGVDRQPAPSSSTRDSSWAPRKNPSVPGLTEATLPAFPVAVPERGYLELPPPPSRKGR